MRREGDEVVGGGGNMKMKWGEGGRRKELRATTCELRVNSGFSHWFDWHAYLSYLARSDLDPLLASFGAFFRKIVFALLCPCLFFLTTPAALFFFFFFF